MASEEPAKTTPYWEALTPEDLIRYDIAMESAQYCVELAANLRELDENRAEQTKITVLVLSGIAKNFYSSHIRSLESLMPPRSAFEAPEYHPPEIPIEER